MFLAEGLLVKPSRENVRCMDEERPPGYPKTGLNLLFDLIFFLDLFISVAEDYPVISCKLLSSPAVLLVSCCTLLILFALNLESVDVTDFTVIFDSFAKVTFSFLSI
jgi:hypothetical protein